MPPSTSVDRSQIVRAALDLFLQRGVGGVDDKSICDACGLKQADDLKRYLKADADHVREIAKQRSRQRRNPARGRVYALACKRILLREGWQALEGVTREFSSQTSGESSGGRSIATLVDIIVERCFQDGYRGDVMAFLMIYFRDPCGDYQTQHLFDASRVVKNYYANGVHNSVMARVRPAVFNEALMGVLAGYVCLWHRNVRRHRKTGLEGSEELSGLLADVEKGLICALTGFLNREHNTPSPLDVSESDDA